MGDYTELILGCDLYQDTPAWVIDNLKSMCGEKNDPDRLPDFFAGDPEYFSFLGFSYFPVSNSRFYECSNGSYSISARCSIKNYDQKIEKFLDWLRPYIKSGSGERDMYAIVTQESDEPVIYFRY